MAIISHKHKLIILRTPKTGSSSFHLSIVDSGILGKDDSYTGLNVMFQGERKGNYDAKKFYRHSTPTMLFKKELITEEELHSYTKIITIRNPIERYISSFFFTKKLRRKSSGLVILKKHIKGRRAAQLDGSLGPRQSTFFKHDDEYLENMVVVPTPRIDDCVEHLIDKYNGKIIKHQLKSDIKPDWAKPHYTEWLEQEYIDIIENFLEKEIQEYQYVMANNQYKI